MEQNFLHQQLDSAKNIGMKWPDVPSFVLENINPKFELREYQKEAFGRFFHCFNNDYVGKEHPLHLLFNMATGSGKTLIMVGLILYLYQKGLRNFLFFVNSTNIIEKTKDNFLNNLSGKYLFNDSINFDNKKIKIRKVNNFDGVSDQNINICFTTIQKLHGDLINEKENALTFEDFKDKKIALIADEAHHGQVKTKQKALSENLEKPNWENTVEKIFKQNNENLLLEFTATMDFRDKNIVEKYRNKVIYKYELKEFRNDGYSKDVELLHTDTDKKERIIQAIILSEYRQEVAAKYGINLKPVILFKAQKTIAQSEENKKLFHQIISKLSERDINNIRKKTNVEVLNRAFDYFKNNISDDVLVRKLKDSFAENKTLSVNEEGEKEKHQILLNSLEDKNNQIRAIFAVQKLNEGWDVLNLFDIVRLYETRDGKNNKPGKTTISEVQLIGRGARYYPFVESQSLSFRAKRSVAEESLEREKKTAKGSPSGILRADLDSSSESSRRYDLDVPLGMTKENGQDKYKRKYDKNLDHELRILEELHYHSHNESRYISEIKTALIEEGMMDEKELEVELKLKDEFMATQFYKEGLVYANERKVKSYNNVKKLEDLGVRSKGIDYQILSGIGRSMAVFKETGEVREGVKRTAQEIKVKDIDYHILRNALACNNFFDFGNLKKFIPSLKSIQEFIAQDKYLAGFTINFQVEKYLSEISCEDKFRAVLKLIDVVEKEIKNDLTEYEGTKEFIPLFIKEKFKSKKIKISKESDKLAGQKEFLEDKDWHVFEANYGTEQERNLVKFIDSQTGVLGEKFDKFYLIRNERELKIYNFKDGRAFEPDYLLFLIDKKGHKLTYQLFIEPKGPQLAGSEEWKENFLKEIKEKFKNDVIEFKKSKKYKIIGLPFFTSGRENEFKEKLINSIK